MALVCTNCGRIYKRKHSYDSHILTCKKQTPMAPPEQIEHLEISPKLPTSPYLSPSTYQLPSIYPLSSNNPLASAEPASDFAREEPHITPLVAEHLPEKVKCNDDNKSIAELKLEIMELSRKVDENTRLILAALSKLGSNKYSTKIIDKIKQTYTAQNNYDAPDLSSFDLSPVNIVKLYNESGDNIVYELVRTIWFNKDAPRNHSMFLLNAASDEVMCYHKQWKKEKFKNVVAGILNVLDNYIGMGLLSYLTTNPSALNPQAKRAREQYMSVRQSFKGTNVSKNNQNLHIYVYYDKMRDVVELMTDELLK